VNGSACPSDHQDGSGNFTRVSRGSEEAGMKKKQKAGIWYHVLFLGPASVLFTIAVVSPFVLSIFYSFTDWNGVSNVPRFVGIKNFISIFTGKSTFLKAASFTFSISIVNIILVIVIGTLAAVILSSRLPLRNVFRLAFYIPNIIGGMVLGFIWRFIFLFGIPAIGKITNLKFLENPWIGNPKTAFWALVVVFVWQNIGYVMVVMTAGFKSISNEVLEAAVIDGSTPVQSFFRIRIPLVMSYITICLFWTIAMAFKMFELCFSLTQGGPYGSTVTLAYGIYTDAFANSRYGLATAESLIFFIIVAGITSLQLTLTKRKELRG
jgi:raffinose/stachyose/melibiose transport system permease protein